MAKLQTDYIFCWNDSDDPSCFSKIYWHARASTEHKCHKLYTLDGQQNVVVARVLWNVSWKVYIYSISMSQNLKFLAVNIRHFMRIGVHKIAVCFDGVSWSGVEGCLPLACAYICIAVLCSRACFKFHCLCQNNISIQCANKKSQQIFIELFPLSHVSSY